MSEELNKKIGQATKWSTITEIVSKLVAPITNAILARLLVPEAFGVVATLTMVTTFAEIFTDAGFQKYLIQHEFENEKEYNLSTNVAFWTNLILSFLIWGVIAVFVKPIASLVGSAGHELAIIIISAEIPLLAFSSIQLARFKRDFDFKRLFPIRMVVSFIPLVVTVPIAFIFHSYWALVIGILAKDVVNAVALTFLSKWKPGFNYNFKELKAMLSFSVWTIAENITIWLSTNIGTLILASLLGSYYLGLYKTTITTVSSYFGIIQQSAIPVMFSALSRVQDNEVEFQNVFFKFQCFLAMLLIPLGVGMFVYHELVTKILLGNQWSETSLFLGMRSLVQALLIVYSYLNSEVFRSRGKPKLSMLAQSLYLVVLIPVLYYGASIDYAAVTICNTISAVILIIITSTISQISMKIRFIDVLNNTLPSLLSAVVMGTFGFLMLQISDNILWQVLSIFICIVIYTICFMAFPNGRKQLSQIPFLSRIFSQRSK